MKGPPTPDVDLENVEFVIFIRATKVVHMPCSQISSQSSVHLRGGTISPTWRTAFSVYQRHRIRSALHARHRLPAPHGKSLARYRAVKTKSLSNQTDSLIS